MSYKYNFGDMLLIDYGNKEMYRGIVFGDNIGYEDGKQDRLFDILEQEASGICKIKKLNEIQQIQEESKNLNNLNYPLLFKVRGINKETYHYNKEFFVVKELKEDYIIIGKDGYERRKKNCFRKEK